MARRNLTASTLKQLRDVQVPTWWTFAQVLVGGLFVLVFAWYVISGDADQPLPDPPGASGAPISEGTDDPQDPTDPAGTPDPDGSTVEVSGVDGTSTFDVPTEAHELAQSAFTAYHDPAVAAEVPTQAGDLFVSPYRPAPKAQVLDVLVDTESAEEITFVGVVDADGKRGPKPSQYLTVTLANADDTWKVAAY